MNAVLYARVSTDKQADKDLSIPAQLQAMREYAQQRDWTVVDEFIEPGASATTSDRPELQRLITRVREGQPKADVVVVHKLDRFARSVEQHVTIRALLKKYGARLASVVENVDDTVSGQLVENIMASIAQFYSANLADEVRKGMRQKVLNGGWPHQPPRGYAVAPNATGKGTHIEIHPHDGPLMQEAFERYASGRYSVKTLALELAREGLTTKQGQPVAHSYLRALLENPFYAGRLAWKDLNVDGRHEPLASPALFDRVQAMLRQRYRDPGAKGHVGTFPLRGLAICCACRGRMTAERHGKAKYYRCCRRMYNKACCPVVRFCHADVAHAAIERVCRQLVMSQETAHAIERAAARLIETRVSRSAQQVRSLHAKQARLREREMTLTEGFVAGTVAADAYQTFAAKLRAQHAALEAQLSRAQIPSEQLMSRVRDIIGLAASLWDLYEKFSGPRQQELLKSVFDAIVLGPDGLVGYSLRAPFDSLLTWPRPSHGRDAGPAVPQQATRLVEQILKAA